MVQILNNLPGELSVLPGVGVELHQPVVAVAHQAGLTVRAEGVGGDVGGVTVARQLAHQTEGGEAEGDGRVLSVDHHQGGVSAGHPAHCPLQPQLGQGHRPLQLRPGRGEGEDGQAVRGDRKLFSDLRREARQFC